MPLAMDAGKLKILCTWMARFAGLLAVGMMAAAAVMWMVPEFAVEIARQNSAVQDSQLTLSLQARAIACLILCLHLGLLCWALWTAKGLFENFARGRVLEAKTGEDLRLIGGLIAAYALLTPLKGSLISIAVTMGNPPGQRMLAIALGTYELILGVLGALILVLGHVMAEAARIADDNRQIV